MRKFAIVFFITFLVLLDLFSKYFAEHVFSLTEYFPIFDDYLGLQLSYNPGIAFSLPITGLPLQLLTIGLISGIIIFYIREEYPKRSLLLDTGYIFILAGALSHSYERIFIGHVVDFIAVKYFAILNFADIFISVGAFLLIFSYAIFDRKHR